MANKKINALTVRTPLSTDLMLVGDPSTGFSYKCLVSDITGSGGGSGYTVVTKTAAWTETATSGSKIILCDTTTAGFTVTLPTAVGNTATITIKKILGSNNVVVDGAGTETIDGGLTATITRQFESITIISNGTNWFII